MKKAILLLSVWWAFQVGAQQTLIPGKTFETWLLKNGYAECVQNHQLDLSCAQQKSDDEHNCIPIMQRLEVERQIAANLQQLNVPSGDTFTQGTPITVRVQLPLVSNTNQCQFYNINNYVDENGLASQFQDYMCGNRTYDGHLGTDFTFWPYSWYTMDHNLVQVVAAAPGTIVYKHDGEADRNCAGPNAGLTANAIVLQHSDGTRSWYFHFKAGTLTTLGVGNVVQAGDFLGYPGSSGNSSGPHLHFEVHYAGGSGAFAGTVANPYYDGSSSCNNHSYFSWWNNQELYDEPLLYQIASHAQSPLFFGCDTTERPNFKECFKAGDSVYISIVAGNGMGLRPAVTIRKPDGTVFSTDTNAANPYRFAYYLPRYVLPANAPAGRWTAEVNFGDKTCTDTFYVVKAEISTPTATEFCVNHPVQLQANTGTGFSYKWYINGNPNPLETDSAVTVLSTGNYQVRVYTGGICDTISAAVSMTVLPTFETTVQTQICAGESYAFHNNLLTDAGTYYDTLSATNTCDSVVILQLQVLEKDSAQVHAHICYGNVYTYADSIFSQSGNYALHYQNANGCDSVIYITLSVDTLIDTVLVTSNNVVMASEYANATYQWLNCSTGQLIADSDSASLTVTQTGSYAAIITLNNCTDTTACTAISVGINENETDAELMIYPNPGKGQFYLHLPPAIETRWSCYDIAGQELLRSWAPANRQPKDYLLDLSAYANGVYVVQIETAGRKHYRRIIISR